MINEATMQAFVSRLERSGHVESHLDYLNRQIQILSLRVKQFTEYEKQFKDHGLKVPTHTYRQARRDERYLEIARRNLAAIQTRTGLARA